MPQQDQAATGANQAPGQQNQTNGAGQQGAPANADGNGNGNGQVPANGQPPQQNAGGNDQGNNTADDGKAKPSLLRNPIFIVVAIIVLVFVVIWGIGFYTYSQNHVSTDDAYVTGDLINVSPIISGTLSKLTVEEGDVVKAGQVIAKLDDSGPRASYDQSVSAYQAAQSQIPQAQTTLQFEALNVNSSIDQARAALGAQEAKTSQSQQQVELTAATTSSQVIQSQAQAQAALAQAETAQAQAAEAEQAVNTARAAASAAHQQIAAVQANATKAQRDATRYAALYGNGEVGAVTAQQYDQAVASSDNATAQLAGTKDSAAQADSQVAQAIAQVKAAEATANAAMRQYNAAEAQVAIERAMQIQVPVQKFAVANNAAIASQNAAQLQAAIAGQKQVTLRKQQVLTAQAQSAQAKAAMINAQVSLDDCTIAAPTDGVVVRKGVNIGDALTPGQTIVTMTRGDVVWVSANFKETQLQYVRPNQPAEVDVDTYPGKDFHGYVQSVNEASGNTTSLLPADNATGNFTKVVQRIPVKIILTVPKNPGPHDATAQDIQNLRQGMSVEATIDISGARNQNH